MVTITGYNERVNKEGKPFYALTVQGGLEMALSEKTGRYYFTAKQSSVPSTFPEQVCKDLIGTKLPGRVSKMPCDPFEFTVQETGEVILLRHRWVYSPSEAPQDEMVYDREPVGTVNEF